MFNGLYDGWSVLAAPATLWQEANKVPIGRWPIDKVSLSTDVQRPHYMHVLHGQNLAERQRVERERERERERD